MWKDKEMSECFNITAPLGMPCFASFGHLKKLNKNSWKKN